MYSIIEISYIIKTKNKNI